MADIKKKFIDILFEDDPDDEPKDLKYDEKLITVQKDSPIRAEDILYRKPGTSAFINLEEPAVVKQEIDNIEINQEEYEMSSQISPIFGLIKENKRKVVNVDQDIIDTQTNKPVDSHLDIITSPIYGYGNKEDAHDKNYDVKSVTDDSDEESELHHLFDQEEEALNKSYDDEKTSFDDDIANLFKLFGEDK